jgi:hypothetical protein
MRKVIVTGTYTASDSSGADVTLAFTPTSVLKSTTENIVVLDAPVWARTNSQGAFSVVLYPMQFGLYPDRFLYRMDEMQGRTIISTRWLRLDVDTPDTVSLVSLYQVPSTPPDVSEQFPTVGEVRALASDLDSSVYDQLTDIISTQENQQIQLSGKVDVGQVGDLVPGLVDGVVAPNNIPVLRFANAFAAGSEGEMLGHFGTNQFDICVRSDANQRFLLLGQDPSVLTNWVLIDGNMGVTSVNGNAGTVFLNHTDVGAAALAHDHDDLVGTNYRATYLSGSVLTGEKRMQLGIVGDLTVATNREVVWNDPSGSEVYSIRPFDIQPWSTIPIAVYTMAGVLVSTATVTGSVRKLSPDTAEIKIDATGFTGQVYFTTTDSGVNSSMSDPVVGNWVVSDLSENPLSAGTAVVTAGKILPMGFTGATVPSERLRIKGLISGTFVTTSQSYLPTTNDYQYTLDIGTVDSGPLDASILGSWPNQQLNLVVPSGEIGPRGLPGPTGPAGPPGADGGATGPVGPSGASAYQSWLDLGNVGTEADFVASLAGTGTAGPAGISAYQSWLNIGNVGTEVDFIASLTGTGNVLLDALGYPYIVISDLIQGGIVLDGGGYPSIDTTIVLSGAVAVDIGGYPFWDSTASPSSAIIGYDSAGNPALSI